MQHHVTDAAACRDKIRQAGVAGAGFTRCSVLGGIAHGEQLKIIFAIERDGVVRALAGVIAPRKNIETHLAVLRDTLRQIRHTNHHVIDTGEHGNFLWINASILRPRPHTNFIPLNHKLVIEILRHPVHEAHRVLKARIAAL